MVVSQTPKNLERVRNVLDCLSRASGAKHFPPPGKVPGGFSRDGRITSGRDAGNASATETDFINIHSLVERLHDGVTSKRLRGHDISSAIHEMLTETIEPDAWREEAGMMRSARLLEPVLIVTHTPKTIAKV